MSVSKREKSIARTIASDPAFWMLLVVAAAIAMFAVADYPLFSALAQVAKAPVAMIGVFVVVAALAALAVHHWVRPVSQRAHAVWLYGSVAAFIASTFGMLAVCLIDSWRNPAVPVLIVLGFASMLLLCAGAGLRTKIKGVGQNN